MYANLKRERERQGKTQREIAQAADLSVRGYQNYELGNRVPSVETAKKIAQALGASIEELFKS